MLTDLHAEPAPVSIELDHAALMVAIKEGRVQAQTGV